MQLISKLRKTYDKIIWYLVRKMNLWVTALINLVCTLFLYNLMLSILFDNRISSLSTVTYYQSLVSQQSSALMHTKWHFWMMFPTTPDSKTWGECEHTHKHSWKESRKIMGNKYKWQRVKKKLLQLKAQNPLPPSLCHFVCYLLL